MLAESIIHRATAAGVTRMVIVTLDDLGKR